MDLTECFAIFATVAATAFAAIPAGAAEVKTRLISGDIREALAATEAEAKTPSTDKAKRHDTYTRLAELLQLSGDIEGAAEAWKNAAYAVPEKLDDRALAEAAVCYVSMGNWEDAASIVKTLIQTVRDNAGILRRAVYLNAQIEAFDSGNFDGLYGLSVDPAYLPFRPAIYYTLWRAGGKSEYMSKLIDEFPDSPEACAVTAGASKFVSVTPSAYWLLFPGRDEASAVIAPPAKAESPPPRPARALQAGLYRERKNAVLQAARLKDAGYDADIKRRSVNGADYWTVFVSIPNEDDIKNAMSGLKKLGFDTFPER